MAETPRSIASVSTLGRRSERLSERLAHTILDDITARRLEPGARLPAEAAMISEYGVARTTLREALRILEVNGLIAVRPGPGGGPVVADVSPAEFGRVATLHFEAMDISIGELVDVRRTFEPLMARLAAEASDTPARRALARALRSRTADLHGEVFHRLVVEATNRRVMAHWARAMSVVVDIHELAHRRRADDVEAHRAICAAILDGDGATAERAMADHVDALHEAITAEPGSAARRAVWS